MSNWVFDEDAARWMYWPMCSISGCQHRICFGLSDKYCYPHSTNGKSFGDMMSDLKTDIRPTETQVRQGLKGILEPFGKAGEG